MNLSFRIALVFFITSFHLFAQSQITGSQDYGMANSSVMWLPRPSVIFLNPALLARIHQGEIAVVSSRFSGLPSMSGMYFVPSFGSFGVGVANEQTARRYTVGYGRLLSKHVSMGGAFNILSRGTQRSTLSFGGAFHLLDTETAQSGLHIGASALNLSSKTSGSTLDAYGGAAYWVTPNLLRLQAGLHYEAKKGEGLGGLEVQVSQWLSVYAGTKSFKEFTGGVGFHSTYLNADLAVAKPGISFTVSFRFTDDARDVRNKYFENGRKAYDEERYSEAHDNFLAALECDEYYSPARTMADLSISAKGRAVEVYLLEAKANEARENYVAAIKLYSQLLQTDPNHGEASIRLNELEKRFRSRIQQLIAKGDSLRDLKKFDQARSAYREALDFDSDNQQTTERLADMDTMIKQRVQQHLANARSYRSKNQIEDAIREYEQVLVYDPKNSQALNGIETLKARRTLADLFNRGKTLFEQANFFEALALFLDVLQLEPNNRDAKTFVDRARETLQREVEDLFKNGLQLYVKENYPSALEVWSRVLLIQPNHQATLEYKKRAQEKLEALERLK